MFQKGDLVTVLDVPRDRWDEGPAFVSNMLPFVGGTFWITGIHSVDEETQWYRLAGDDPKDGVAAYLWDERWLVLAEEEQEPEEPFSILDELYGG